MLTSLEPRVRVAIAVGTLAMLAMFAAGLYAVSRANDAVVAAGEAVRDSRERLVDLQAVLSALQDAETGERGYVITGDENFLGPYRAATRDFESLAARLRPDQATARFRELHDRFLPAARAQLELLAATVERRRAGDAAGAAEPAAAERARLQMEALRALVAGMRGEVEGSLVRRYAAFEAELQRSRRAAVAWLGAAFLSSLGMVILRARYLALRRRSEAEAAAASDLLRATVEHVGQGILVLDGALRALAWNGRFLELRGLGAEAIAVGTSLEAIVRDGRGFRQRRGAKLEPVAGPLAAIVARRPFEAEVVRDDGVELEVSGRPTPGNRFVITYADVTPLRRSETAARDQAARLDAILNNVQDAIVTINESGSIESFNAGAERMFGWRADEVLRRNVSLLMPDPHRSGHDRYLSNYLRTGHRRVIGHPREMEGLHRNGALVPVELGISEMWLGDRRLFVGVLRDISDRRRMQRLQNEFISTVSHELRTPLTSIVGALGLLRGGVAGEFPAPSRRLVDMAHDNGLRLVRLVNDFLDLEKMQAGKLEFRLAPHALVPLVRTAVDANRAFAQGYGVELVVDAPPDDLLVYVDPERLQQVITNLVSNAVKFSPRGAPVEIGVAREGERAVLTVRDRGPGIPPEFRHRIFEKFAQADASDARGRSGTGLGLSIVKSIVERLDGEVSFETGAGRGTTFRVSLPPWRRRTEPAPPAPAEGAPAPGTPVTGATVLVVEDDPDIVVVLRELLAGAGYAVEAVGSGAEALDAFGRSRPDAILLDLNLPDRNGRGLVHEFRRRLGPARVPIMILSATFGPNEARDAGRLGADECFEKPVDGPRLLAALATHVARAREGG